MPMMEMAHRGRPLEDHEKWMSGGGIKQWAKRRRKESVEEGGGIGRVMGWRRKAVTKYFRLLGGKGIGRWWEKKLGRTEDDLCPKCGEEAQTLDHIVFWCRNIRRVKALKKWVRMEESGRVDDE